MADRPRSMQLSIIAVIAAVVVFPIFEGVTNGADQIAKVVIFRTMLLGEVVAGVWSFYWTVNRPHPQRLLITAGAALFSSIVSYWLTLVAYGSAKSIYSSPIDGLNVGNGPTASFIAIVLFDPALVIQNYGLSGIAVLAALYGLVVALLWKMWERFNRRANA